jgi:arylsulfatase A-like enzyme
LSYGPSCKNINSPGRAAGHTNDVSGSDAQLAATGAAFGLDPVRLVYSLRWKHNAEPPDLELVLLQTETEGWVNTANLTLLGELRRRAPEAINWAAMQDIVPTLDAFEAHMAGKTARRH